MLGLLGKPKHRPNGLGGGAEKGVLGGDGSLGFAEAPDMDLGEAWVWCACSTRNVEVFARVEPSSLRGA